jgi:hypothetical protein
MSTPSTLSLVPLSVSPGLLALRRRRCCLLRFEALDVTLEGGREGVVLFFVGVVPNDFHLRDVAAEQEGGKTNGHLLSIGTSVASKGGGKMERTRGGSLLMRRELLGMVTVDVVTPLSLASEPEVLKAGRGEDDGVVQIHLVDGDQNWDRHAQRR